MNQSEKINEALSILERHYQQGIPMREENLQAIESLLIDLLPDFTDEQRERYEKIKGIQESYAIRAVLDQEKPFENPIVRKFRKHINPKIVLAGMIGLTAGSGITYQVVNSSLENSGIEATTVQAKEVESTDKKEAETKEEKTGLTKETVTELYAANADLAADMVKTARENGLAMEADEAAHLISIANLSNLTDIQKYELASAKHPITMDEWTNFTNKLKIDLIDVTPDTLALDAKLLFGDTEAAKDANRVMQIFAQWNVTHDSKLQDELKSFLTSYTEEETFRQNLNENPAAVEFVLNACSLAADDGINLLDNDAFSANLFTNTGCKLEQARQVLGANLQIDQQIFRDDTVKITDDSMSDTKTLKKNSFLNRYNDDQILQIKFVANQMDLTSNQEQDFANHLDLNQTISTWRAFSHSYTEAIANGLSFDASQLFLNDEKAANELNQAQSIYQEYLKADDTRKAELYNQWNELYYRNFLNNQDGILESNKPASYLLAELLQKASVDGLTLEKADSVNAKDQNGTSGLYKIIVGNGLSNGLCNTMSDITLDKDGNQISNRTLWEEIYSDIASSINSAIVTSDKAISNSAISLYEKIVLEGRATTEIEERQGINRHDIFVEMIEERVKDIKLQNVTNPEDVITARLGAGSIGGYTLGGGSTLGDIRLADASGVTVTGEGSVVRDENLELWTPEEVARKEEEANSTKGKTEETRTEPTEEKVVEEEKKEEVEFTDRDKEKNEEAADKGSITEEEKEQMNKDKETIEGDLDYDDEHNLSPEDFDRLTEISNRFSEAEEKYHNGQISEDEFQKAVEEFERETDEIFKKYSGNKNDQNQSKEESNTSNNTQNSSSVKENDGQNTKPATREEIVEDYKVDLNNSFEYEGKTYYYSEEKHCYVDLDTLILSDEVISEREEKTTSKVVEETVISEEDAIEVASMSMEPQSIPAEEVIPTEEAVATPEVVPVEEAVATPEAVPAEEAVATPEAVPAEEAVTTPEAVPVEEAVATPAPEVPQTSPAEQIQELEALKEQINTPVAEETQTLGL